MYILSIKGKEDEGAYAVCDDDGDQSLYFFEDEDDAERYAGLLEAEDYPPMTVVEVDPELALKTCDAFGYDYVIISPDEFVIPPREYDFIQKDKIS
jgi:hypothetical protein